MATLHAVGALLVALAVSGCADEQGAGVSRAAVVPADGTQMESAATGTLRADPSTGCLWLEGDNGDALTQLLLQGDYQVDFSQSPPAILDGDSVVARAGERVELGGGQTPHVEDVKGCPVATDQPFLGYFDEG